MNQNQNPDKNNQELENLKRKKIFFLFAILGIIIVVLAISFIFLRFSQNKKGQINLNQEALNQNEKKTTKEIAPKSLVAAYQFASYEEVPVNISPKVPAYSVKQDLSNVDNAKDLFYYNFSPSFFSDEEKKLFAQNAFMIRPSSLENLKEFFSLYERNRYSYIPNFITTDSILHNYHLFFDFLLKKLEEEKLIAELKNLSLSMFNESIEQFNKLEGTEWENAARRNVGFFAVGNKLLGNSITIPSFIENEVNQELALIEDHNRIEISPLINIGWEEEKMLPEEIEVQELKEDYSQYVPRGHYNKTDQLKAYFKAMMWYGRITFRLKIRDEVKSAILMTLALNKTDNQSVWNKIYEPINFFVGKSDDIGFYQFKSLIEKVYGENVTVQLLTTDNKFFSFFEETKTLEPPQINSIPIFSKEFQPDREAAIKGFRFMGQRFTIDASIFQRLVDREVPKRKLPKALDIPAVFGSEEALNLLMQSGETKYENYSENMAKLKSYISSLEKKTWTQNLYWGWLYQLLPLLEKKREGYPSFMQNVAWTRKELNTFLGSWAELKHDTILYSKQVYSEIGGGGDELPSPPDDRGYVEPNPYVYARLVSMLRMMKSGLEARELLVPSTKNNLDKMEQLTMTLKTISEKELNNEKLTDEEYELIRSYGGQLEHFWIEVNKDDPNFDESSESQKSEFLNQNPAAIIADVATDPDNGGRVLEVGIGPISEIYVIVPIDGKLKIARGGVFSYYEFEWPLSDRLTDQRWRELLNSEKAPELPSWTDAFTDAFFIKKVKE